MHSVPTKRSFLWRHQWPSIPSSIESLHALGIRVCRPGNFAGAGDSRLRFAVRDYASFSVSSKAIGCFFRVAVAHYGVGALAVGGYLSHSGAAYEESQAQEGGAAHSRRRVGYPRVAFWLITTGTIGALLVLRFTPYTESSRVISRRS